MMVFDDFLLNPEGVRALALSAPYVDWAAPDGEIYKRVCLVEIPGLRKTLEAAIGPVHMLGMGYRLNYNGELPNAAIHSDLGWGTHALVLYLSEGEGGTAFWRHKATGAARIDPGDTELFERIKGDWDNENEWEQTALCPMKFNRAVIYESVEFHSRYPFAAFGNCPDNGRLIGVAFFNVDPSSH